MMSMRRTSTAIGVLTAAGILLAGCAGAGGNEAAPTSEPSKPSALASFDPCTALPPEELQGFGVEGPGEPADQGIGEVGCQFEGEPFFLGLYKAEGREMAYWNGQRGSYDRFESNSVGGHQGFLGVTNGATGKGICNQTLVAGGGSVIVQVSYTDPAQAADPCADAVKVAEAVAPKLPK